MPGVIFIICIPSNNYEHILKFGKPKDLLNIEEQTEKKLYRLEVELRSKNSRSNIPMHYYNNDGFNPVLDSIDENGDIAMENVNNYFKY